MYKILTLNNISPIGLCRLPEEHYQVTSDEQNPDGILLRSYNMHDMPLPAGLKAVARAGAGVNNIPIDTCTEAGVVVFNTPGANANAVRELVMAGLLLSSRRIIDGVNWVQGLQGETGVAKLVEKGKSTFVGPELFGKKLGVIGLGAIGVLVANAANAMGMEVYGYDPFMSVEAAWSLSRSVRRADGIDMIIENCDYITIHVPLNDDTRKMFNKDTLARMKKEVRILNFSRGELVDDEAMIAALDNGTVGAYVTDFPNETLLGHKNIITIPHLGASTPESEDNCAEMAAIELKNYLEYGNIENSVNFPSCYMPYVGKKRICIMNRNVPNVVGSITTALAQKGMNIDNMLNKSKGDHAYTMIDVDGGDMEAVAEEIRKLDGIIAVRTI